MKRNILVSACLLGVCCRYDGRGNPNEAVLALLSRDDVTLIPVCPEQLGGLPTPRVPSERLDGSVINRAGEDVTAQFNLGAEEALKIARLYHCRTAILKERSPSCGCGKVYDGTFSGSLTEGNGVTAELLRREGIEVYGESRVSKLFD
jgi:uncharacterized protein YbbK (DUF523 family)